MSIRTNHKHTLAASCVGYVTQGIVNNFAPLLFLTFQTSYGISLEKITLLITLNFVLQLLVDLVSTKFIDKIGYRTAVVAAHAFALAGMVCLAFLPDVMPDPYVGILVSVILCALGGGLDEVLISPIVESCPTKNKSGTMSFLHSFYSWGVVLVIAVSTVFFLTAGIGQWKWLALAWAVVPLFDAVYFCFVPIYNTKEENEKGIGLKKLFSVKLFWVFALLMMSAGAAEIAMSQWASAFAEGALGVDKTMGDLLGPCMFALMMSVSRTAYAKFSERLNLSVFMIVCACLCVVSYIVVSFSPIPALSLAACGLCGFSVGIMWPGGMSIAVKSVKNGGTALFAMLALFGDVGATAGPTLVGLVSGALEDNLQQGLFFAVIFPLLLIVSVLLAKKGEKRRMRALDKNIK
ncbi:MAG: MFS transporter [Bacillota bacterium]|nr:MAG: MFS transporter [Bacillota bacterium]